MRMWRKRNADLSRHSRLGSPDQLLCHETCERRTDRFRLLGELLDRAAVEELSLDRPPFGHHALLFGQPVETRRQQRLQRWRRLQVRSLEQHRQQLLDEERVASADSIARRRASAGSLASASRLSTSRSDSSGRSGPSRSAGQSGR